MSKTYPGQRNPNFKHGGCGSREYRIWKAMRNRCTNPKTPRYTDYGGRGIRVCKRWDQFENFLADMGHCPDGCTLDRVDNSRGYSPTNCRWASLVEQARNCRSNRMISAHGRTLCLSAWAELMEITTSTLWKRLARRGSRAIGQVVRVE